MALGAPQARATTQTVPLGVNIEGVNDWQTALQFVDVMKSARDFGTVANANDYAGEPHDANGWPNADTSVVFFDGNVVVDYGGTYHLSFNGQATLDVTVTNQTYNSATNTTTADITLPANSHQLFVGFTNTKKTASSGTNTGISNVKLIRPGYAAGSTQLYTDQFIAALNDFSVMRFMDALSTNGVNASNVDPWHTLTDTHWSDRTLPSFATQADGNRNFQGKGMSWEYIIALCNQTGKDAWINIPVSADDNYITQLATLIKNGNTVGGVTYAGLNSGLHVYVEYSNEVWNFSFPQNGYNFDKASAEVNAGGSNLNYDGSTDPWMWHARRYAKRSKQISDIFKTVWGASAINTTIRPVLAWQMYTHCQDQVEFIENQYGAPNQYFYALSIAPYYNADASNYTSISATLSGFITNSDSNVPDILGTRALASFNNLKFVAYEGGTSPTGASTTAQINTAVAAMHNTGITNVLKHDLQVNWYPNGGDLYVYYNLSDDYWGLVDTTQNLNMPKLTAINQVIAEATPTVTSGHALPGSGGTVTFPAAQVATTPAATGANWINAGGPTAYYLIRNASATTNTYTVTVTTAGGPAGSSTQVAIDGQLYQTIGTSQPGSFTASLSPGLHGLRLRILNAGSGEIQIDSIKFVQGGSVSIPPAPTGLTATAGNAQVALSWTASSGATSYNVRRSTVNGSGYATVSSPTGTTYTNTGLTNGTTYYFVVTATNSAGTSGNSNQASATPAAGGAGSLTGSAANASGMINLTTVGTSDWAHWGTSTTTSFDHKSSGGTQISNFTKVGTPTLHQYGDDAVGFTWTGGTPTTGATNSTTGIYIAGVNKGYSFTAPADTTSRTLKIYCGGWMTAGTLTAHLSDGSAADYVGTGSSTVNTYDKVFTITYKAASAGKTLTVTWVETTDYNAPSGNITLNSAALQ